MGETVNVIGTIKNATTTWSVDVKDKENQELKAGTKIDSKTGKLSVDADQEGTLTITASYGTAKGAKFDAKMDVTVNPATTPDP